MIEREVLGWISEMRVGSLRQIARRFYRGRRGNASRAMKKLEIRGLVRGLKLDGQKVYATTTRADLNEKPLRLDRSEMFLKHYLAVNEVRDIFERSGLITEWISESKLKREAGKKKVPDGVVISAKGKKGAVEVETSHKRRERVREILSDYTTPDRVFVVCRTNYQYSLYSRIVQEMEAGKIYIALASSLPGRITDALRFRNFRSDEYIVSPRGCS